MASTSIEIFCCYSRKDQDLLENLRAHLAPFRRQGLIKDWNDTDISPGINYEDEINRHLDSADIILLLVSPDFMNSDYCYSKEMERAMQRHNNGEARVVPIILRPVHFHSAPFGKIQALPSDARPVRMWRDPDEAFYDVTASVVQIANDLLSEKYAVKARSHEKANALTEDFLLMARHELKTPLTTIRGHVQLGMRRLSAHPDLPPDLEALLTAFDRIDQQTSRLSALIDNLLDLTILLSGEMTLHISDCNLAELCDFVSKQQSLSGRTIKLESPLSPLVLQADNKRLSQVVTNLLANALEYSPENSAIQVRVSQAKGKALIQVHNEGQPIPPDEQTNLFEPFYRAPAALTSSKRGWGLGLAISKQIVDRHNGRIWVESTATRGTTFSVELPMK